MKYKLISAFIFTLISFPALAALEVGEKAPDFSIPASLAGKTFQYSLSEQLKKGPVVVYFYPSAYTNGCNLQAHTFSVNSEKFSAAGASIVGISLDSINRLNDFSADPEYCAGKFPVASDADAKVSRGFELAVRDAVADKLDSRGNKIDHGFAERTTFVITSDGKVAAAIGGVAPADNVQQALSFVENLQGKSSKFKKES
jgi:thioredoxin-dependent peroxiredoxin